MTEDAVNWPDAVATMCFIVTAGVCFVVWVWLYFTRGGDDE